MVGTMLGFIMLHVIVNNPSDAYLFFGFPLSHAFVFDTALAFILVAFIILCFISLHLLLEK